MIPILAAAVLAGMSTFLGGEAHRRTERGNAEYEKGKTDAAFDSYQRAQAIVPEAPQLHYDLGNVLYRQENWAGAAEAYEQALGAAGPDLAPKAAYNLGNALFRDERYDEAVKAYMRALKSAPKDLDAKHNLELALRALQAQQQKKPQQQQQQDKKPQDQKPQDQDRKQQGQGDDKKQDEPQQRPGDDPKRDGERKPQPRPGQMSKEEARKLLDRLSEEEKDNVKRQAARAEQAGDRTPEKDW